MCTGSVVEDTLIIMLINIEDKKVCLLALRIATNRGFWSGEVESTRAAAFVPWHESWNN